MPVLNNQSTCKQIKVEQCIVQSVQFVQNVVNNVQTQVRYTVCADLQNYVIWVNPIMENGF